MENNQYGKKEEITDVLTPEGIKRLRRDQVLHFGNSQVGHTYLKITKIDRKNGRVWAEHVPPFVDFNTGMSHYGHNIDTDRHGLPFCRDCKVEIDTQSTEEGDMKAVERAEAANELEKKQDDPNQLFKYTLLKQDGTKEELGVRKKMVFGDMYKILDCRTIELIPMAYWKMEYNRWGVEMWGDEEARFNNNNVRNPHFLVLEGDPSIGEPAEWDVMGDVIVEELV